VAVEDQRSPTLSPFSFGNDIPSSFRGENGFGFETHLREERFQKLCGGLFISGRVFGGDLNQLNRQINQLLLFYEPMQVHY
jgi:hypothetical protein